MGTVAELTQGTCGALFRDLTGMDLMSRDSAMEEAILHIPPVME
jgi:hypothetical protein